jgi:hypothetical protein
MCVEYEINGYYYYPFKLRQGLCALTSLEPSSPDDGWHPVAVLIIRDGENDKFKSCIYTDDI